MYAVTSLWFSKIFPSAIYLTVQINLVGKKTAEGKILENKVR